ncbi:MULTISPECIES: hypothetical protein [Mycolicibacter]|uniref:Uncharacterized protein n=2 Tax=Mycolicibacter TaxID=1073531 RepID=A0ABU5XMN2_9MYCO|nr:MULTISPECIES: hypothetical protein [unclassified Mycolicibacter]MEB3023454.1 hypothetical protein [Mycolicibacter sp. MYC098]MEB3033797.1 hypothetical protein [Mycolicibacter sp. MYC340]
MPAETVFDDRHASRRPHQVRPHNPICAARPRVRFADASRVRQRVEAHAAPLRLAGAPQHVLGAVLGLLCGKWSRITDDSIRLTQIAESIVSAGGRRYDLKTVGRALGRLVEARLITYVPAQGRGARATIAIHEQFTTDIEVLKRGADGRVITESVTFSDPDTSYRPNNYLPTLQHRLRNGAGGRPTEVDVHPKDVTMVLSRLPAVFAQLPVRLRWKLGREIRIRLAAGFEPEQILAVLAAPLPAEVQRPWRLALWRLQTNMPGSGPRLAPLQREWDQRELDKSRKAALDDTDRWYRAVARATTAPMRARLLVALQARLSSDVRDDRRGLAHVGRMAVREFGSTVLADSLRSWLDRWTPAAAEPQVVDHHDNAGHDVMCVSCLEQPGVVREELPLKSVVCDHCWAALAEPELVLGSCDGEGLA